MAVFFALSGLAVVILPLSLKQTPDTTYAGSPNNIDDVLNIRSGGQHSLALTSQGKLYTFGNNEYGQLGLGYSSSSSDISLLDSSTYGGETIIDIAAGTNHSFAVTSIGHVYAWGDNTNGRLGNGTEYNVMFPILIDPSSFNNEAVTHVATYDGHSLAITYDGSLFAWGKNDSGQLGDGTTNNSAFPVLVDTSNFAAGVSVSAISVGEDFSMVLLTDGSVFTWGNNSNGQLGQDFAFNPLVPSQVPQYLFYGQSVSSIVSGAKHSFAITEDEMLFAWGANGSGQLGDNSSNEDKYTPIVINPGVFSGSDIFSIGCGSDFSACVTFDGSVYIWGNNTYGELGSEYIMPTNMPMSISSFSFENQEILSIFIGQHSCFSISINMDVYAWGRNDSGQLGKSYGAPFSDFSTLLSPQYVFSDNLFTYKTCTEYDAAYNALNDDYSALTNEQKNDLQYVYEFDYVAMNNPDEDDYDTAPKSSYITANVKWDAICELHNNAVSSNLISTTNHENSQYIIMIVFVAVTVVAGICLFYYKRNRVTR